MSSSIPLQRFSQAWLGRRVQLTMRNSSISREDTAVVEARLWEQLRAFSQLEVTDDRYREIDRICGAALADLQGMVTAPASGGRSSSWADSSLGFDWRSARPDFPSIMLQDTPDYHRDTPLNSFGIPGNLARASDWPAEGWPTPASPTPLPAVPVPTTTPPWTFAPIPAARGTVIRTQLVDDLLDEGWLRSLADGLTQRQERRAVEAMVQGTFNSAAAAEPPQGNSTPSTSQIRQTMSEMMALFESQRVLRRAQSERFRLAAENLSRLRKQEADVERAAECQRKMVRELSVFRKFLDWLKGRDLPEGKPSHLVPGSFELAYDAFVRETCPGFSTSVVNGWGREWGQLRNVPAEEWGTHVVNQGRPPASLGRPWGSAREEGSTGIFSTDASVVFGTPVAEETTVDFEGETLHDQARRLSRAFPCPQTLLVSHHTFELLRHYPAGLEWNMIGSSYTLYGLPVEVDDDVPPGRVVAAAETDLSVRNLNQAINRPDLSLRSPRHVQVSREDLRRLCGNDDATMVLTGNVRVLSSHDLPSGRAYPCYNGEMPAEMQEAMMAFRMFGPSISATGRHFLARSQAEAASLTPFGVAEARANPGAHETALLYLIRLSVWANERQPVDFSQLPAVWLRAAAMAYQACNMPGLAQHCLNELTRRSSDPLPENRSLNNE